MKAIVYYDGQCSFCLKSVSILKKLDWFKRLDYYDSRKWQITCITPEQLLEQMHVSMLDKGLFNGFEACRELALLLPLLWPVVPFLYIPGVPWLGQKFYMWVARNRSCKDGVCKL